MKSRILLLAVPALVSCTSWSDDIAGPTVNSLPATLSASQSLADRYIVVFKDDVPNPLALSDDLARQAGATVHYRYTSALKGFAATIPPAALEGIQRNPNVAYVEADGIATVSGAGSDNTVSSWGLDRIDERDLPMDGVYTWNHDGTGVRAYILDTGIRTTHTQFGGRAVWGTDVIDGSEQDCHGHGTHVAGTVGGIDYGVARAVTLVAVRVLNCQGSGAYSTIIAGVDWVKNNAIKPAVANMSLGGGVSSSLNTAVNNAVASGVVFAVAAGNENTNACNRSPASAASALTVGATGSNDARASFSNYGTCVDIFAPGVSITSATITNDGSAASWSGTSMASPHVAGVVALYLSANTSASPSAIETAIEGGATPNKVTNAGTGSPNLLLYSRLTTAGGGSNPSPTASFTYSCTDLTCNFNGGGSTDDGSITNYSWNFGDGSTGTGVTPNKTYTSAGTRTVTLTVTDNLGATGSSSQQVTVSAPPPPTGFVLTANGYKVKGVRNVDLSWTGASGNVDVYRNGVLVREDAPAAYTDVIPGKGAGTFEYLVCNANSSTCSNSVTVVF